MTTPAAHCHGIVLLAHGSRDPLWRKPIEAVAEHVALLSPQTPVVCAYLELSQPDFASAATALITQGVQSITVLPLFLGVGKHARADLPRLVEAVQANFPTVCFTLKPAVGEDERLVHLLAQMALDCL